MIKKALVTFAALLASIQVDACNRSPRPVEYLDSPVQVYVSQGQWAEVSFPENSLEAINFENGKNLKWSKTKLENKLMFSTSSDEYHGFFIVHGQSGKSYLLNLVSKPGCSDSIVNLTNRAEKTEAATSTSTGKVAKKKSLIQYMIHDDVPSGYRKIAAEGGWPQRLVMETGSVKWYLKEQLVGSRYIGTTLEVINEGRTPFRVDIQNIDYSSPAFKEAFGKVVEVTMNPFNFRLGPSPEYISEVYANTHRGYVYIVSAKEAFK